MIVVLAGTRPANFSNFYSLRERTIRSIVVDARHELSQREMNNLREIVDVAHVVSRVT